MSEKVEIKEGCLIWPYGISWCSHVKYSKSKNLIIVDSNRVGAKYSFDQDIKNRLNQRFKKYKKCEEEKKELENEYNTTYWENPKWIKLDTEYHKELQFRAKLTTIILEYSQNTQEPVKITNDILEEVETRNKKNPYDRAERLLTYFSTVVPCVSHTISIVDHSIVFYKSMAYSESVEPQDMFYLCDYLVTKKWLEKSDINNRYKITVEGYEHLNPSSADSKQAFVAMAFNESTKAVYDKAIKPAIEKCGYKPIKINEKLDVVKIDDEIIAEIKRSRFVIADTTPDPKKGARGNVYFEAGFAMGHKIDVIFLCKENDIDKLHFDINHYLHIKYESDNMDDLKKALIDRIRARIN